MANSKPSEALSLEFGNIAQDDERGLNAFLKKVFGIVDEQAENLETANVLIDEQSRLIDRLRGEKPSKPTVKVGKKEFTVVHGVNGFTPKQISENKTLAAELVKSGSTALVEVIQVTED